MPYIKQDRRIDLFTPDHLPVNVGELNFKITTTILHFLDDAPFSYERINGVIGVLECAKLELYRRVAVPYEQQKCSENGDVY